MDDRSDYESSYFISDDDEELEIKPPQAKVSRHSSHFSSKYSSGRSGFTRVAHRSSRHQPEKHNEHHAKNYPEHHRSGFSKLYELEERLPDYNNYKRKKSHDVRHHELEQDYKVDRFRDQPLQDLREKIERRKHRHHIAGANIPAPEREKVKDIRNRYERIEVREESKKHRSKITKVVVEHFKATADDRGKHYHHRIRDDKKVQLHEKREMVVHEEKKKSDDKKKPEEKIKPDKERLVRHSSNSSKNIVIEVETSPAVLKEEPEETIEQEQQLEDGEVNSESNESSSEASSSEEASSDGSDENSSSNSSESTDTSEETEEDAEEEEGIEVNADVKKGEENKNFEKKNLEVKKSAPKEEAAKLEKEKPIKVEKSLKVDKKDSEPDVIEKVNDTKNEPDENIENRSPMSEREKSPENTLPVYYPAIQGCRSVEEFKCLNRIAEGTYGVVYRALEKRTDRIVALKRLKMEKEKDGFPITSLREINTLLKAQHPNIVTVREIVVGSNMDKIFIVMDYVEHDLKSLMELMKAKKMDFKTGEIKCLMLQLLSAVAHLHDNWILHRDLKTSNLLLNHKGVLKVGDFGLAREYGSPLKPYTPVVVTLWYRAPELLLGSKQYSTKVDMWSVGCIFAEIIRMDPLFPGKTEPDQLKRIFLLMGTPNPKEWPQYSQLPIVKHSKFPSVKGDGLQTKLKVLSKLGVDLLEKLFTYCPEKRITAEEAARHEFFNEYPISIEPSEFRKWPAKSEFGKPRETNSPKPPAGGRNFEEEDDVMVGAVDNPQMYSLKSTFTLRF